MSFKVFLESDKPEKVLVLVHPDCSIEKGANFAEQYTIHLKQFLPTFDYVITHLFFEDDRPWTKSWDERTLSAHKELYSTIKALSDVAVRRDGYGCSYSQELPEFLLEHPRAIINMAGGYENNCLWLSYKRLFKDLDWMFKEQKHEVFYYKPLIFQTDHREKSGYPEKNTDTRWDAQRGNFDDFHPGKVRYSEQVSIQNIIKIPIQKIYAWIPKLEETLQDIKNNKLSYSKDKPIVVSKFGRNFFILDGHHRMFEAYSEGKSFTIDAVIDKYVPDIERTGGAYNSYLSNCKRFVDFI